MVDDMGWVEKTRVCWRWGKQGSVAAALGVKGELRSANCCWKETHKKGVSD